MSWVDLSALRDYIRGMVATECEVRGMGPVRVLVDIEQPGTRAPRVVRVVVEDVSDVDGMLPEWERMTGKKWEDN